VKHELKTWPEHFAYLLDGEKTFELRLNDRDFKVGDTLELHEWSPESKEYTGRKILRRVSHILYGGNFGLRSNHCCMSLSQSL